MPAAPEKFVSSPFLFSSDVFYFNLYVQQPPQQLPPKRIGRGIAHKRHAPSLSPFMHRSRCLWDCKKGKSTHKGPLPPSCSLPSPPPSPSTSLSLPSTASSSAPAPSP